MLNRLDKENFYFEVIYNSGGNAGIPTTPTEKCVMEPHMNCGSITLHDSILNFLVNPYFA